MADPILMAIAEHALAYGAMNAALDLRNRLQAELQPGDRRSDDTAVFETDDPRWIENERNASAAFDFEADAALGSSASSRLRWTARRSWCSTSAISKRAATGGRKASRRTRSPPSS